MSSTSSNNNTNNVNNVDNVGADGSVNNPAAGDVSTASVVGNATNDVLHNRINHMRDNNARNSPIADLAKGVLGGAKKPSSSSKEGLDANKGIDGDKEKLSPAKKEGNQNNSTNPGTGVATGNKPNSDNTSKPGNATPKGKPSIFSAAKNGILNSTPAMAVKNGLSKVGLGPKPGLEKKDEEKSDDKDKKEGGQQGEKSSNSSLLNGKNVIPIGNFKISVRTLIIIGAVVLLLVFALIVLVLVSILSSVDSENDMCVSSDEAVGNYTGSRDVLEFICKMRSPYGDKSYPVYGYVGQKRPGHTHQGVDLSLGCGTEIDAAQDGKVVTAGWVTGYGNAVVIKHDNGKFYTRYGHMQKIIVSVGDNVVKGQNLGETGNTGNSQGCHLHFEIRESQEYGPTVKAINDYFNASSSNLYEENGHKPMNVSKSFLKNCGSSAASDTTLVNTSAVSVPTEDAGDVKSYTKYKSLKTITSDTGKMKKIYLPRLRYNPQSIAYNNGIYYVIWTHLSGTGKDGRVAKYDSNAKYLGRSSEDVAFGHGNGLTYSTVDNLLYATTTSRVYDKHNNNKKSTRISPNTLKQVSPRKSLEHGTSGIAFDKLTQRFITSSGASSRNSSDPGYLYVYDSNMSKQIKRIKKKRWNVAQDIGAYGGIVYVCIHSSSGNDYIDMYNEDTGDYLGSYTVKDYELESVVVNDAGELVILYHNTDAIQFTGIKVKVIKGTSDDSSSSSSSSYSSSGDNCCVTNNVSTSSSGNYCPNGITVTGRDAGTYDFEEYVERVTTCENGGADDEAVKALSIAVRTYALSNTNNCKNSIANSTKKQVMSTDTCRKASDRVKSLVRSVSGSVMLYKGELFSAQYSSFYGDCSGDTCTSTFYKVPSNKQDTFTMPKSYLTTGTHDGHQNGLSQNGSNYMSEQQGKTYDEILKFFYADDVEITGASSNSCSLGGNGTFKGGNIRDYNQAKYSDAYCGGTIADSGCGPTAMAMVVSTMLNEDHDPPELAKASNICSTDSHDYFIKAAKEYGLTAKKTKEHDEVLTALNRGDSLVIANVSSATVDGVDNFWTSNGHYIVLAGHSGRDVWVQDPHKGGDGRGNDKGDGVYNFDTYIKPAVELGYIIITKGVSA